MSPGCSTPRAQRAPCQAWPGPRLAAGADSAARRTLVHHPADVSSHRMTLDLRRGALLAESRRPRRPTWASACARASGVAERARDRLAADPTGFRAWPGRDHPRSLVRRVNLGLAPSGSSRISACGHPAFRMGLAMASTPSLQIDGLDRPPTALGPFQWSWTWKSRPDRSCASSVWSP